MIKTSCFQDLTRKTKIKGLTTTSWLILIVVGFACWFIFLLYSLVIVALLYGVLFLLEYFDEDIYQILELNLKISHKKYYA
ncbi:MULTISPECIES: hypothetical protein [Helicobacter]|uniref:VirB3 type IV secretion protein n=3 Tax=Helicobacter ganmani TaxID=60246 RepID=A0A3D8IGD1_9HELI|nr:MULTISPECIES: hypothetical protein [Helicobacter]RDU64252.1 hypothetical protein CQA43_00055 [Helicobacter ganmani]